MLRFLTSGESHGKGVTVIIDGYPANVEISLDAIQKEMSKRKTGMGSGGRMSIEDDKVEIISGIRFGKTLGSPITLYVENKDYKNWGDKMSPDNQEDTIKNTSRITQPRPGHADLAGALKYRFNDIRNVLERASARETTARVMAGAVFKQLLSEFDIEIVSHTIQIGNIKAGDKKYSFNEIKASYDTDPETRCLDKSASEQMKIEIQKARTEKDTLGGVIEIWANNVPAGLGSYIQYDRKIDGQLAQALMSIPSVKAVEIGNGIENASNYGSQVQDEIFYEKDKGYFRHTNRAGGIEGGVTNGMPIIIRVFHKPISTIYKPLNTVDIVTKQPVKATVERSDICIVPRAGVISESMLAYILAKNILEKFGSDNIEDILIAYQAYKKRILSP